MGKWSYKAKRKPGPVNNIDNYKGITLISNSKILENVIMNYIEENSCLTRESRGVYKMKKTRDDIHLSNVLTDHKTF